MSRVATLRRDRSRSTRAMALFSVPAGPATFAPWSSKNCASSLARTYSSSTIGISLPASSGVTDSGILRLYSYRTTHTVGLEGESRLGVELIRQRTLDELGAVAEAPLAARRGHGN